MDVTFQYSDLLGYSWWIDGASGIATEDPYHFAIEIVCILTILFLVFKRDFNPKDEVPLSTKEEDAIISVWKPLPLVPETEEEKDTPKWIVESASSRVAVVNGREVLNFASNNFLGLADREEVKEACRACIDKYGVGSCGPRGFYGSFDVHMDLETQIAQFYGVDEAILYSDGMACVSSVIPAFAKKGDLIICDEGVNYGIQQGIYLSRSKVKWFKHNSMKDLRRILEEVRAEDQKKKKTLTRRWIIVEGLYQDSGNVCTLDKVVDLKNEFKFRLLVDDSMALGVLGKKGRGSPEHWDMQVVTDIECLVCNLDATLASCGGFCVGDHVIVDHQRLSGAGYVFSASSPPYTATAASVSLGLIESKGKLLCTALRKNVRYARDTLSRVPQLHLGGDARVSPVITIQLKKTRTGAKNDEEAAALLKQLQLRMFEEGVALRRPQQIPAEHPRKPQLQLSVTALHSSKDLDVTLKAFQKVCSELFD